MHEAKAWSSKANKRWSNETHHKDCSFICNAIEFIWIDNFFLFHPELLISNLKTKGRSPFWSCSEKTEAKPEDFFFCGKSIYVQQN